MPEYTSKPRLLRPRCTLQQCFEISLLQLVYNTKWLLSKMTNIKNFCYRLIQSLGAANRDTHSILRTNTVIWHWICKIMQKCFYWILMTCVFSRVDIVFRRLFWMSRSVILMKQSCPACARKILNPVCLEICKFCWTNDQQQPAWFCILFAQLNWYWSQAKGKACSNLCHACKLYYTTISICFWEL